MNTEASSFGPESGQHGPAQGSGERRSFPIPESLKDKFIGYMQAGYDDDDAPDGAWFCRMESDAFLFMAEHKIPGEENDAVFQLLDWIQPSESA